MLSSRNEWIVVGVLIVYLAFIPSLQIVRDMLSTSIGKAVALAAIVYVYKYVSCSAALLLVIAYVRCSRSVREMLENPPAGPVPASDTTVAPPISMPPSPESGVGAPINTMPPTSGPGAPVNTMPPNPTMSTAPMTTPTATMPPPMMPPNTSGGVQPSTSSSSSVAPV